MRDAAYILLIDLLGFSDAVLAAEQADDVGAFDRLQKVLRVSDLFKALRVGDNLPLRAGLFSDSFVVRTEASSRGFNALVGLAHMLCPGILAAGMLPRGVITFGRLYDVNEVIFGSAVIRAVKLEREAKYPRVVIDPLLLGREGGHGKDGLRVDEDGVIYVDLFSYMHREIESLQRARREMRVSSFPPSGDFENIHRTLMTAVSLPVRPRDADKVRWMVRRWNEDVAMLAAGLPFAWAVPIPEPTVAESQATIFDPPDIDRCPPYFPIDSLEDAVRMKEETHKRAFYRKGVSHGLHEMLWHLKEQIAPSHWKKFHDWLEGEVRVWAKEATLDRDIDLPRPRFDKA